MKNLTALVHLASKNRTRRYPAHAVSEHWAITDPLDDSAKAMQECPWVVVTHQPTGYRARDVKRGSNYQIILKRFERLFGGAVTVRGVMRKYKTLSAIDKRWLKRGVF